MERFNTRELQHLGLFEMIILQNLGSVGKTTELPFLFEIRVLNQPLVFGSKIKADLIKQETQRWRHAALNGFKWPQVTVEMKIPKTSTTSHTDWDWSFHHADKAHLWIFLWEYHYLISQVSLQNSSFLANNSLILLVGSALSQARQWPVQLSPVPGGIIDPQTVQTTTSAWNQARGTAFQGLEIFRNEQIGASPTLGSEGQHSRTFHGRCTEGYHTPCPRALAATEDVEPYSTVGLNLTSIFTFYFFLSF